MFVDGFTDDEFVADDPVTLISRLDVSNPLHLHPNDSVALTVVEVKLKGIENYQVWSCAMLLALDGKNKIGFIDGSCRSSNTDENGSSIANYYHRETLPDVRSAYATISSEESYRVASSSISGTSHKSQTSAFVSSMPNKGNFQTSSNTPRPSGTFRPNNVNNNRQGRGFGLVCENCGFNGHTIDVYFKPIGYLADFGKV
nr:ribonuclease H-like domain-containing protein [Tanacetum cinerariifolium]